jgi:gliding motility-associated-like protein
MKKLLLLFTIFFTSFTNSFAQGTTCPTADPFCTGTTYTFPNNTGVADAGDFDCLMTTPNPAWYYLQIANTGPLTINIEQTDNSGFGIDVDFAIWGPFTSTAAACATNLQATSAVDCSYSTAAQETCVIPNAVAGEWYMLLLTNFADDPGTIEFSQTGGSGSTNCNILCNMTGLTATPGACAVATNTYTVTGTITYTTPPSSGTLTVTNSCSGVTQVFNAPFNATTASYSLAGLPANGAGCTVTAVFSADPTCTLTQSFTAPPSCAVNCAISAITATPTACAVATQQYDVSGSVTFVNAPASGTLTISNSCGGTPVVLNAPFTSPAAYTFTGLGANSASCTVTAVFSANAACTLTQNYSAPAPCPVNCSITGLTATPTACAVATQQYDVSGSVTFVNAPATGTLTITNSCGGTPVVLNAPFTSPAAYSFTGLAANSAACTITAAFSADAACTLTQNYSAPAPCPVICSITSLSATASACDPATNNYSVTGSVGFVNAPATGTLTVSSSCGGVSQVFNAPFISPMAYALNGLSSDGAACVVTAVFSADAACTLTQNYTAPAACVPCPVTAGNDGPHCVGETLNLTATNLVGATYSWTGPNGFVSAVQNPTINNVTVAAAGVYTVTISIVAPIACTSTSSTTVVINPLPVVTVNSPVTCVGVPTTLTANGATSYVWSSGQATNTISAPGTSASYTVTGTTNGCTSTAIATVTTSAPPVVNFSSDVTSGCNALNVNFTADTTGNAGATYTWLFGDGTSATGYNPSHLYTTNGCHDVVLTVSFGAGCSTTDTISCMINVFAQPVASFVMTPLDADIINPTIYFTSTSTYSSIWLWNFGDGTGSGLENPSHTYPDIGTYPVTLYASNSDGCIDSVTQMVMIQDVITIYIPNSFTPNGDNVNDIFYVYSHGIDPKNYELLIFDRWGNRIFTSTDQKEGWNGAVNNVGDVVQQDVYVYRLNYKDIKGKKKKIIGHVTIVK